MHLGEMRTHLPSRSRIHVLLGEARRAGRAIFMKESLLCHDNRKLVSHWDPEVRDGKCYHHFDDGSICFHGGRHEDPGLLRRILRR